MRLQIFKVKLILLLALSLSSLIIQVESQQPNPQIYTNAEDGPFIRHNITNQNQNARCLDGSPYYIYINRGVQSKKIVIYMERGSICAGGTLSSTLDNCYISRYNTQWGSSQSQNKHYAKKVRFTQQTFLSDNQFVNPLYYNWTKVYVPYCDGAIYVGNKDFPVPSHPEITLHFRGQVNLQASIQYINLRLNLKKAKNVVFTGTSAGGISSFIYGNYISQKLQNKDALLLVPDAAIFPAEGSFLFAIIKPILGELITESFPLKQCVLDNSVGLDRVKCVLAGVAIDYIQPKAFFIQSLYDTFSSGTIARVTCTPLNPGYPDSWEACDDLMKSKLEEQRTKTQAAINHILEKPNKGVWAIACSQHVFTAQSTFFFTSKNYVVPWWQNGKRIVDALRQFSQDNFSQRNYVDTVQGLNGGCNGILPDNCMSSRNAYGSPYTEQQDIAGSDLPYAFCTQCNPGYDLIAGNLCLQQESRR